MAFTSIEVVSFLIRSMTAMPTPMPTGEAIANMQLDLTTDDTFILLRTRFTPKLKARMLL